VTPTGVRRILNNAADRALATRHARPRWPFGHKWRWWTWRTSATSLRHTGTRSDPLRRACRIVDRVAWV
jgi:hypothetical protein